MPDSKDTCVQKADLQVMIRVCVGIRAALLVLITFFFVGLRLLVWPSAAISRPFDRILRRFLIRGWGYCFAYAAGLRVVVKGTPPRPPFYMVCNHLSYLDMLVLARQTGCIFVSRGDVEQWPFFGFVSKSIYVIFINRDDRRDTTRVNLLIEETIREQDGIVVFPEGYTSPGVEVKTFRSPLLQPPVELNIPVHYATISYDTPENGPSPGLLCSWWRPEPFYAHTFRFLHYPGAVATIHFGEQPISGNDRKSLAKQLEEAVRANFVPLRQEKE